VVLVKTCDEEKLQESVISLRVEKQHTVVLGLQKSHYQQINDFLQQKETE